MRNRARRPLTVGVGLSLAFATALFFAPSAVAHNDGCLLALHLGSLQAHQICTSTPATCFSNVSDGTLRVNLACEEPDPHPCVFKIWFEGRETDACL